MAWQQAEAVIFLQESLPGCAQHMPLSEAARLGVYLHGCAGDTNVQVSISTKGFHSMTASDVLNAIPELLKRDHFRLKSNA